MSIEKLRSFEMCVRARILRYRRFKILRAFQNCPIHKKPDFSSTISENLFVSRPVRVDVERVPKSGASTRFLYQPAWRRVHTAVRRVVSVAADLEWAVYYVTEV